MANAKRLMSVVLILAMLVTMASFPVSAADASQINPISVTSPFTAGGSYNIFGVIDGSETADPNYFRADKNITSTGSKGNDANLNVVVDLGGYYNLTKIYTAFGAQFATGVALWGSNDNATWTELDDLTLSAQRSTTEVSHEGFYRYIKVEAYKTKDSNPAILEITFYGDSDPLYCKVEGLNGSNVVSTGASQRYPSLNQNLDTLFDGDVSRTNGNGIQYSWTSQATKKTIEVTLNDVVDVAILRLYWGNKDNNAVPAQTYNVYLAGEDGVYGESVYDYTDSATKQDGKSRNDAIFFDPLAESVKKIKIEITDHYKTGDPAIREIEIVEKLDESEVAWADYTVNYVDTEGNPVFESKVVTNKIAGREVTETAEELAGYRLEVNSQTVTLVEGMNTITFTYEKMPDLNYTVKYVDVNGDPIAASKAGVKSYPYDVTESAVYVEGYYKPASVTKTLSAQDNVIEIVYEATPEKMTSTPDTLLENATVKGSGSYSNGDKYPASNIIDGDKKTFSQSWWSKTPTLSYVIDLGKEYDINDMSLLWCGGSKSPNWGVAGGGIRPTKYTISVSADGTNYTTVYKYEDLERTDSTDVVTPADFTQTPVGVRYVKIYATETFTGANVVLFEVEINGYLVTDRIVSASDYKYYATGSTAVNFPATIMTVDPTSPEAYLAPQNWVVENCTVDSVTVEDVSDPASNYYTWKINVKAIPDTTADSFALELDLPDTYVLHDKLSFGREASDLLFNSAIADGDNAILLDKTNVNIAFNADGSIATKAPDRTVHTTIKVQEILESGLPYKGYNDVVVEVTELKANGGKVRFDFEEDFVRVGDEYYGSFTFTKAGVERFEATVVLYGVNADGSKTELDKKTIFSDIINITDSYPKAQTDAEKAKDYTHGQDLINQLVGLVHPYDLPVFSEDEWTFYKAVLEARGMSDKALRDTTVQNLQDMIANELAKLDDPNWVAPDYQDDIIITNQRIKGDGSYETVIRVGAPAWNVLKNLHVNSFSIRGPLNHPTENVPNESMVESFYVTFRNGIDYDYTNCLVSSFNLRMKDIGASSEYADVDLKKGYNAVRRALNDDQAMPIMFRLDWYNWPSASSPNPFTGGVITVQISEDWTNNNGMFNLATYQMTGYSYKNDNDPELTLMKDKVQVSNYLDRYVSVEIDGDRAMYDTYVIVGTDKLPSELPETIGTYFDVE